MPERRARRMHSAMLVRHPLKNLIFFRGFFFQHIIFDRFLKNSAGVDLRPEYKKVVPYIEKGGKCSSLNILFSEPSDGQKKAQKISEPQQENTSPLGRRPTQGAEYQPDFFCRDMLLMKFPSAESGSSNIGRRLRHNGVFHPRRSGRGNVASGLMKRI